MTTVGILVLAFFLTFLVAAFWRVIVFGVIAVALALLALGLTDLAHLTRH